jgi:hypothetical protein
MALMASDTTGTRVAAHPGPRAAGGCAPPPDAATDHRLDLHPYAYWAWPMALCSSTSGTIRPWSGSS